MSARSRWSSTTTAATPRSNRVSISLDGFTAMPAHKRCYETTLVVAQDLTSVSMIGSVKSVGRRRGKSWLKMTMEVVKWSAGDGYNNCNKQAELLSQSLRSEWCRADQRSRREARPTVLRLSDGSILKAGTALGELHGGQPLRN